VSIFSSTKITYKTKAISNSGKNRVLRFCSRRTPGAPFVAVMSEATQFLHFGIGLVSLHILFSKIADVHRSLLLRRRVRQAFALIRPQNAAGFLKR
jgi:hypothetical protein